MNARRWSLAWIAAGLLGAGCSGNAVTLPLQPSSSPAPPIVMGRGTLAVINRADPNARRVWVFPPHSDQFREIIIPGSNFEPNSLAFDRRGHLYIGINNTSPGGGYQVMEVNLQNFKIIRDIRGMPSWPNSSVAIDDQNVLYVNTKAFIGGDIKMFRRGESTPSLEIKEPISPLTTLIAQNALWIGNEGFPSNVLTRYRLYSTDRTLFETIGRAFTISLAVNPESSLIATFVRRNSTRAVDVIDVKSGKRARTLLEGNRLQAMTSDGSGRIYISEVSPGKIHICDFQGCHHSFETHSSRPEAIAVSPLDGNLYVANLGKANIQAYDRTGKLVTTFAHGDFFPSVLAIEP
jgi:DNA-binding beta-propeller fold protein YncE